MTEEDDLLAQAKALQSCVEMVNSLKTQNQELINALETIVNAKEWIGRDYKAFAWLLLRRIRAGDKGVTS